MNIQFTKKNALVAIQSIAPNRFFYIADRCDVLYLKTEKGYICFNSETGPLEKDLSSARMDPCASIIDHTSVSIDVQVPQCTKE